MKKGICLLLSAVTLASAACGLSACSQDEPEEGTVVEIEDDSYDMAASDEGLGDKIVNLALSGIGSGISGGVSSVVSSVGSWAAEGIIKALGFQYYGDESFKEEVLSSLGEIKSEIISLEGKIDWLTSGFSDTKYLDQYSKFVDTYQSISKEINVLYKSLSLIEKNIEANEADNLDKNLADLCAEIKGSGSVRSDLDVELTKFGNYFMGSETSVDQLQQYSIFRIAERFVCSQTPYQENIYSKMQELVSQPYSAYYVGYSLVTLAYTYELGLYGVNEIWLDGNGDLIGYQMQDQAENQAYLNCTSIGEQAFRETYQNQIAGTILENATAQSVLNATYNGESVGGKLNLIIGYLSQITEQYNSNSKLYQEFIGKYAVNQEEGKLTLAALNQKAEKKISTVWARDILSVNKIGSDGTIKINFDAFGNISMADFENFAQTILPYTHVQNSDGSKKDLTFREFFRREGFEFPSNNSSNYLILGAEIGVKDYDDYWNNGRKYCNAIAVVSVNLDMTVSDFVKNKNYVRIYYVMYCSKKNVSSSCGPKFEESWSLTEGTIQNSNHVNTIMFSTNDLSTWTNTNYVKPVQYFTIKGLSALPKTGIQGVGYTF